MSKVDRHPPSSEMTPSQPAAAAPPSPGPIEFVQPPPYSSSSTNNHNEHDSFSDSSLSLAPHLILYCLPHAGGSPSSFRGWQDHLHVATGSGSNKSGSGSSSSSKMQIRVLSLPGRGGRFNETQWDDWGVDVLDDTASNDTTTTADSYPRMYRGEFISALTQAFLTDWDGMTPYAFFGHSFGTLIAYELTLQLQRLNVRPLPLLNAISAHRAPGISPELAGIPQTHTLPREDFVDMIRTWGLVPDDALDNDELVDIMIPALRADLKLDETHTPPSSNGVGGGDDRDNAVLPSPMKLPVPMVVYGGTKDQTVPSHQLKAWKGVASGSSESKQYYDEVWFEGDHFYTVTHLAELMADLGRRLGTLLDGIERSIMVGGECGPSSTISTHDNGKDWDHCLVEDACGTSSIEEDKAKDDDTKANSEDIDDEDSLTVLDLFFAQVRRTPGFLAMIDETGKEWTYTELQDTVLKLGEYLIRTVDDNEKARFGRGDIKSDRIDSDASSYSGVSTLSKKQSPRVGIFLHHASAYLLANLSSWYAGCSVVLLERNWSGALLREFVDVCMVDVVITDDDGMNSLRVAGLTSNDRESIEIVEEEKKYPSAEKYFSSPAVQDRLSPRIVIVPPGGVAELLKASPDLTTEGARGMDPSGIAFVSMTSGSTGKPSAVLTTHRGTRFCFEARYELYPYRSSADEDRQEREGVNVFFAWESTRPLLRGHVVVIIPDDAILSPRQFINFLQRSKITRLVVTPSLLESVLTYPHLGDTLHEKLGHMYGWFLMGEVVPMRLVERAERFLPKGVQLVNVYSSWEALDVSYSDLLPLKQCQIRLGDIDSRNVPNTYANVGTAGVDKTPPYAPVGFPLPKVHVLLLDDNDRPVPRGVPGTLHVLTPALALGYLDDPVKTSARFRQVPPQIYAALLDVHPDLKPSRLGLGKGQGAMLFNSGDVGRILPDGQLGLLGRGDDTVKLRGYKVGIPFVESILNGIEGVATALVLPVLDDVSRQPDFLVAYIVGSEGKPTVKVLDGIAQSAREVLPPFAVPRDFIGLEMLPLRGGESRKLDKKALPVPPSLIKRREKTRNATGTSRAKTDETTSTAEDGKGEHQKSQSNQLHKLPTNRLEQIIMRGWVDVLHLEGAISRTDNFFDVGGNSLSASELIGCLSSQYGLPLSVLDLYQHSSLGALIEYCRSLSNEQASSSALKSSSALSLRHRRRKFRSPNKYSGKIAIIGMSGRFPGASNLHEFWENIKSGKDSLRTFSKAELAAHGLSQDVYNNPNWIPVAQVIDDADKFDAAFWDISPREAKMMDPQHRVFLEVAWSAFEDAGYPPSSGADGPRTGVWAACGIDGYLVHHLKGGGLTTPLDPAKLFLTEVGNEKDYISTRVSYALDLGGPSMTVASACSSGLVAIAQAAQSLMMGQIDVAIAGASSLTFPNLGYCYEEGMVGSSDGHVRPFDDSASGTLFGDGVGAVVLKRLEDAIEDGDHIWSLLTGFDITNDGRQKAGYAAPSASAQAAAIVGAMEMAGVCSESISYVECHATATHVGDAIELRGLSEAFQATAEYQGSLYRCALGSVKSNIGHANCAAGVSGLIKTVLMMKNRVITPTAHFAKPNSKLVEHLDHQSSPFYINRELNAWDVEGEQLPRRAGVSSFGIGGTNAHVILEEFTGTRQDANIACDSDSVNAETTAGSADMYIFPVAAKSCQALKRNIENLAVHLEAIVKNDCSVPTTTYKLRDIAYTLQRGREGFHQRASVVAGSYQDAISALQDLACSSKVLRQEDGTTRNARSHFADTASVVMCFPGQGSHYPGMARALYNDERGVGRLFRKKFDSICAKFKAHLDFELRDAIFAEDKDVFAKPTVTQPAIFAVELSLAQMLMELGVQPVAVAGHSIGEYVAATVSGVLREEDAAMLIAERAKATAEIPEGKGTMLFVKMPLEDVEEKIRDQYPNLSLAVAAINGPEHLAISGSTEDINVLAESLEAKGILCRRLKVTHAFHSHMMAPVAAHLVECAKSIQVGTPRIPLTSNVTGRWISSGDDHEMADPDYWGKQTAGAVRWSDCCSAILRWHPSIVIEVGPGNTLVSLLSKCIAKSPGQTPTTTTLSSLPHARDQLSGDCLVFNKLLATLWEQGIDINWALYNQGPDGGGVGGRTSSQSAPVQRVPLPSYSFEKTSHWINPTASIYVTPEEQLAPVYKVAWQPLQDIPASISETKVSINEPLTIKLGFDEIAIDDALVSAVKSPHGIVLVMQYPPEPTKNDEIDMGWNFLRFVQDLTSQTASGRVTMICVASPLGALAVGASRSVVQEYPKLEIMRLFLPASDLDQLQTTSSLGSNMSLVLDCCKGQTDVLLPDGLVTGGRILGQILEPMILDNPKPTLRPARPTFAIDEDDRGGVYLITGGTGALGQALIKRLISQHHVPEKRIILLSRSRKEKENTPFPKIRTIFVDCSDPLQLKSNTEIQSIDNVSGIFHLAGMLDDAIVANQSLKRLSKVVAPKVAIATLLELAEKQEWNPRFVLTYSSTTSLLGYAGQSNYGAANAILDHMANDWGSQDDESTYPTIAVNWGSWGEVGMAKEGTKAYDTSIRQGDLPMSTSAALGALEALFDRLFELGDIRGQYAITGMNWPASPWRTHPILNSVISKGADQRHQQQRQSKHSPSSTNASPALSSSANAQQSVEELLSNHLSRWDPEETLVALGLDSLDMLQLVRDVSNTFAIDVGLQDVMRASQTLSQFIERVVKEILEAA